MDTIKILDKLEVGMPLIVTTASQGMTIRDVCLYMGKDGEGRYTFLADDLHMFAYSQKYIIDHVKVETEIQYGADLCQIADLCQYVINNYKGGK